MRNIKKRQQGHHQRVCPKDGLVVSVRMGCPGEWAVVEEQLNGLIGELVYTG